MGALSMPLFDVELARGAPVDAGPGAPGGTSTASTSAAAASECGDGWAAQDGARGVCITVKELSCSVVSRSCLSRTTKTVQLLHGVTGYFEPGCMAALMGPSGSGKTTCLDLIAGRKNSGQACGEIRFGGAPPSEAFLRRCVGYVEQFDTLLPILSVEEMLMYTCQLKRARQESWESKKAAVEELIRKLALETCRATRIGDPLRKGISGGEAKRTSIAVQLISSPRALLLDEPTSGLDSFTANEVLYVLKGLAEGGVTILATVHSPSSYGFGLFDSLMVLLRGRVVYFGPSGGEALDYVAGLPAAAAVPRQRGIGDAEWIVGLFTRADRAGEAEALAGAYKQSKWHAAALAATERLAGERPNGDASLAAPAATAPPWWWALLILFKYRTLRLYRTKDFLMARFPDKIVQALVLSSLYFGAGANSSILNLVNIAAVLFMWTAVPAFGAAAYCPSIVLERPLFIRERQDGLYRTGVYLLSRVLEELGVMLPGSLAAAAIVFFAVRFQGSFLVFWVVYASILCCGIAIAHMVAAVSPTMELANAGMAAYVGGMLFFSGLLIRIPDIPSWWRWFMWIDPLHYAFKAAMLNEFGKRDPPFVGGTLLEFYEMAGAALWAPFATVWAFFLGYILLAGLFMSVLQHHKR